MVQLRDHAVTDAAVADPCTGRAGAWPGADDHWSLRAGRAHAVVAGREVLAAVGAALREAGTLYEFAESRPGAVPLAGRGTAYSVPMAGGRWVVRHYRRGGSIAPLLGDRYIRLGSPRPLRELRASLGARARGIATPRVMAAVVYPAGPFLRGDLATELIPDSADLAEILFGRDEWSANGRIAACAAAAALVRQMCEAGVLHRDLNLKNILIQSTAGPPVPHLLDLDRCRILRRLTPAQAASLRRRLSRSVRKWESISGNELAAPERRALGVDID